MKCNFPILLVLLVHIGNMCSDRNAESVTSKPFQGFMRLIDRLTNQQKGMRVGREDTLLIAPELAKIIGLFYASSSLLIAIDANTERARHEKISMCEELNKGKRATDALVSARSVSNSCSIPGSC